MNRLQVQTDQIRQLTVEVASAKRQTEELRRLASKVGDQIAALPPATLLRLADLIQKSLARDSAAK